MNIRDQFNYNSMEGSDDKLMYAEQVSLPELAREVGTPLYVYSSEALIERYKASKEY